VWRAPLCPARAGGDRNPIRPPNEAGSRQQEIRFTDSALRAEASFGPEETESGTLGACCLHPAPFTDVAVPAGTTKPVKAQWQKEQWPCLATHRDLSVKIEET
jgi:hypothetical protein